MKSPAPSVGRIVHYQSEDGPMAAIITAVGNDGVVALSTFYPGKLPGYLADREGNATVIPYAEKPTPGHWNWPPRV